MAQDAGEWSFEALGTHWQISTPTPVGKSLRGKVIDELDRIDREWSRFRDDSSVTRLSRDSGRLQVHSSDLRMVEFYRLLHHRTNGLVTPLVGNTLASAGYDPSYTLRAGTITPVPQWDDVVAQWGHTIELSSPVMVDVGAAGKGFAVDQVSDLLEGNGFSDYVVDGSGDMVISGAPRRVALEHPADPTKAVGVMTVQDGAICGSSVNRRAWGSWHHIVDPRSARPTDEVLATWVCAEDAMTADGLSTALFFTPATQFDDFDFDFVIVRRDWSVEYSSTSALEMFT